MDTSCAPTGHMLRALVDFYASDRWVPNICEWVDNGYDASAKRVCIEFGLLYRGRCEFVRISDNGHGCSDLQGFFQPGKHVNHANDEESSGSFGTGGKLSQAWACDASGRSHVVTIHNGIRYEAACDWERIFKTGDWRFDPLGNPTSAKADELGTILTIAPCVRRLPEKGDRWENVIAELGYLYAPALLGERELILRRQPGDELTHVSPWRMPDLASGSVEREISIGRRRARVRAGILKDNTERNPKAGLTYRYMHRAMRDLAPTYEGCADYAPNRFIGTVDLVGKDWPVTLNKDALKPGGVRDDLFAAVYESIHHLLLEAKNKSIDLELEARTERIAAMLNGVAGEALADAKAKRKPRVQADLHPPPAKPGTPHGQAEKEQAGDRFPAKKKKGQPSRYNLGWADFEPLDERVSKFVPPMTIVMNTAHPWVIANRASSDGDEAFLVQATHEVATHDLKNRKVNPQQQELSGGSALSSAVGRLLKRRMELGEQSAKQDKQSA